MSELIDAEAAQDKEQLELLYLQKRVELLRKKNQLEERAAALARSGYLNICEVLVFF
jgi:hypothetical protein